jgi:hypothetical protein
MKSLIWKEWHENIKWTPLPTALILGPIGVLGLPPLMNEVFLVFMGLVAIVFGAALGFVQMIFESSGDKRSLLLHRPLTSARIFMAKSIVGLTLYLFAMGIPFACIVCLAATPGHIPQPFEWPMAFPLTADLLTGIVFYFAGMLTAQREARWYGSRALGLAAGLFCWYLVWIVPELWQALAAILVVGAVLAFAAWGSFHWGGAYAPQPVFAKLALALAFLMGFSAISFTGKLLLGAWSWGHTASYYRLDRQGQVLLAQQANGSLSLTDLQGKVPAQIENVPLDARALDDITAPWAKGRWPKTRSYRNSNRSLIKYGNDTELSHEWWWYVPSERRLFGYDKNSFRPLGSFGPDGFAGPGQEPRGRFPDHLAHTSRAYSSWANDYLTFASGVYKIDFRKRIVQSAFVPGKDETVLWATRWENEKAKLVLAFVWTDRAIHVLNDAGARLLTMPLARDLDGYEVGMLGRLENPTRYWVWYEPVWYRGLDELESAPSYIVMVDSSGREILPRQAIAPRPGFAREFKPRQPLVEASTLHAWFGLLTPPVEVAVLSGATQLFLKDVRKNQGNEIDLALSLLAVTTQHFVPGVRWYIPAHADVVYGYLASMLLSALVCALICLMLARRHAFSRARCAGWAVMGCLFGWVALALMLALEEWPAHVACSKCRKPRVVTRGTCEHCAAPHGLPEPDGTEIFEEATEASVVAHVS